MGIHNARKYLGDRLIRTAKPHRILDPAHGPLIAVRLNILTRKTLGGLETDLLGRVFGDGRRDHARALCRRRSRRLWRRRHARLSLAGGHVPRRLPVFGPHRRARGREGGGIGYRRRNGQRTVTWISLRCGSRHDVIRKFLTASALGKNLFDILTSIEYTDDLRPIILQTIEYHLGAGGKRAQTRPDFIATGLQEESRQALK